MTSLWWCPRVDPAVNIESTFVCHLFQNTKRRAAAVVRFPAQRTGCRAPAAQQTWVRSRSATCPSTTSTPARPPTSTTTRRRVRACSSNWTRLETRSLSFLVRLAENFKAKKILPKNSKFTFSILFDDIRFCSFQIFNWTPNPYNSTEDLPAIMPDDLKQHIKLVVSIWLS